jgi:hypothetical protein
MRHFEPLNVELNPVIILGIVYNNFTAFRL